MKETENPKLLKGFESETVLTTQNQIAPLKKGEKDREKPFGLIAKHRVIRTRLQAHATDTSFF